MNAARAVNEAAALADGFTAKFSSDVFGRCRLARKTAEALIAGLSGEIDAKTGILYRSVVALSSARLAITPEMPEYEAMYAAVTKTSDVIAELGDECLAVYISDVIDAFRFDEDTASVNTSALSAAAASLTAKCRVLLGDLGNGKL